MRQAVFRWLIPLVALLLVGPAAGWLTRSVRAEDGGVHASLLESGSPVRGVAAGIGVFVLAGCVGAWGSRAAGARLGMFAAGLVLAWGAWGTGQLDRMLMRSAEGGAAGTLWVLAVEGVLVGGLLIGLVLVVLRMEGDRKHGGAHEVSKHDRGWINAAFVRGLGLMVAVGALAAWLVAQEFLKGQTVAAAVIAGVLGATVGKVFEQEAGALAFVAGIAVLAVVSPLLAMVSHGSGAGLIQAAQAGTFLTLARPLPLDWAAGGLIGIPMGLSWAASMLEKHGSEASAEPAKAVRAGP